MPSHRAHRLMHLGGLAMGVAGGVLAEGARRMAKGEMPDLRSLVLTPDNAARLADKLSQMRGAAMKVGQLLSMEAGDVLPPEFVAVLSKLREDAHFMPIGQLADLLEREWGPGWEGRFERFAFTPLAAASIGQVHEARTKDGRHLAIKIQYPGVRKSIDSDVDNVAGLLRLLRIFPEETQVQELLGEAKRQLHEEADYLREAEHIRHFSQLLAADPDFVLPAVSDDLTTANVLAMSFVPGVPVESLLTADQALRDRVASAVIGLLFREFFEFGVVQTDPNFANYRYDADSGRIGLLDFGASRRYPPERMEGLRRLMAAAWRDDPRAVETEAMALGYLVETDSAVRRQAVADLFRAVCEPARAEGAYDFGTTDLVLRLRESSYAMGFEQGYWRAPPADLVFIHRKLAGLFLLCARLKARVDAGALLRPYLA